MAIRILHTADWQIGKQFESLGAPPDKLAYLRQERLNVVRRLGDLAVSENVRAILVAGDVFDRNEVSDLQIRELLHVLRAVEIPWLLLPGNHDPFTVESVWERMLRFGCPLQRHSAGVVTGSEAAPDHHFDLSRGQIFEAGCANNPFGRMFGECGGRGNRVTITGVSLVKGHHVRLR